jgi:hypothetical protein
MGMSNMVLLDENSRPVRYDTPYDILEAFYSRRLPVYQQRKDYILGHLTEEITTLNHKIRYIRAVINKEIRFINRKKKDVYEVLDRLNIPHEIYNKGMQHHLSEDDIIALTEQIASKELERQVIEQTTPSQMWIRELDELEDVYRSHYNLKKNNVILTIGPKPKNCFPKSLDVNPFNPFGVKTKQTRRQAKPITMAITPKSSDNDSLENITSEQKPIQLSVTQNPITMAITPKSSDNDSLENITSEQKPIQLSLTQNPITMSITPKPSDNDSSENTIYSEQKPIQLSVNQNPITMSITPKSSDNDSSENTIYSEQKPIQLSVNQNPITVNMILAQNSNV